MNSAALPLTLRYVRANGAMFATNPSSTEPFVVRYRTMNGGGTRST
jgi:hypothetical protein